MKTAMTTNNRGSALMMVMFSAGILSVVLVAGLTIAHQMQDQTKGVQSKLSTVILANYLATNLENPTICKGSSAPFSGLQFYAAGSATADQNSFNHALGAGQQSIAFGTALKEGAVRNGARLSQFNLNVTDFYIQNVTAGTSGTDYFADVYIVLADDTTKFVRQRLGRLYITATGSSLTACHLKMEAKDVCESMACHWDSLATPSCQCTPSQLDCRASAQGGQDNLYVNGYIMATGQPICESAKYDCPAGQYFNGFTSTGQMDCRAASFAIPPAGP